MAENHKVKTASGKVITIREDNGMFQQLDARGKPIGRERTSIGKIKRRA